MNSNTSSKSVNVDLSNRTNTVKKYMSSNLGLVVVFAVMLFLMIYVLYFIYTKYNTTSLKTVTMLKKPMKVNSNEIVNLSSSVGLPDLYNGKEFSYSFWMYVEGDTVENTMQNKFVIGRMTTKGNVSDGNPVVIMDKSLNKLYVYVRPENGDNLTTLDHIPTSTMLSISYLPLQRWVNVILVVDNNFLQLFMDGELREVKDLSQNNMVTATPVGNIMVGGSSNFPSFNGYISKVQAFNYAVTIDHAKVIYKAGPLHKSILANIGVPYYGIQSPFYRIDEKVEVDGKCST